LGKETTVKKTEIKQLIEQETAASEATRDRPLSKHAARKGQTRSVVYSIRLTPEQTAQIQQLAAAAGLPAAGLVRDWVLQGLAAESNPAGIDGLIDALSRDVDRVRRAVRRRASRSSDHNTTRARRR
jgi:hypothetical protein